MKIHVALAVEKCQKFRLCNNFTEYFQKDVLPVAVLGMDNFDVTTIDPTSVTLAGVAPLRWSLRDAGTPYEPFVGKSDPSQCTAQGPDGYLDMAFKFGSKAVAAALGTVKNGEVRVLQLRGKLLDGTEISGTDAVSIISRHGRFRRDDDRDDDDDRDHDDD